jgi:hypothetical protein
MIATKTTALILAMTTSLFAATPAAFAQTAAPEPEICPGQPWFVLCPANIADASIVDSDTNSVTNTAGTVTGDNTQTGTVSDDDTNTIGQEQDQTPIQTQTQNVLTGLLGTVP